ncbi:MAG: hypothetical protein IKA87_00735, partial [Lentisphaeria bacterium]|nr:hypothetical protein [Lentisphaeria bacterium]
MDLQKIYTDSDFQNAVVPAGQILIFNGLEDGKVVTRYKDSSGNFGTIAGSGGNGSEGIDIILGQVNADGKFQGLSFNGLEASDSGNPETVENYCGWNGTLPVPDGGIKINNIGAAEYYKCTSVDTVNKTWTGYKAVLTDGVYSFEESETTGLTYGAGYSPVVGSVYSDEALVKSSLWAGSGLYGIDDQTVAYITFDNGDVDDLMGHEVSSVGGTPITGVSKGGWNFSGGYIEIQPWGDEFVFGTGDFTFEANLFPISNAKQCFMSYYDTQEFSPSFSTT